MAIDGILYAVAEVIGAGLNAILQMFGMPELKAKRIVGVIASILLGILIFGLFYITFKYS